MSNHGLSTNRHLYQFREQIRFRETTMPMMVSIDATSADAKTRGKHARQLPEFGHLFKCGRNHSAGSGWEATPPSGMGLTDEPIQKKPEGCGQQQTIPCAAQQPSRVFTQHDRKICAWLVGLHFQNLEWVARGISSFFVSCLLMWSSTNSFTRNILILHLLLLQTI